MESDAHSTRGGHDNIGIMLGHLHTKHNTKQCKKHIVDDDTTLLIKMWTSLLTFITIYDTDTNSNHTHPLYAHRAVFFSIYLFNC
jgi:hypothetical protein